MKPSFDAA